MCGCRMCHTTVQFPNHNNQAMGDGVCRSGGGIFNVYVRSSRGSQANGKLLPIEVEIYIIASKIGNGMCNGYYATAYVRSEQQRVYIIIVHPPAQHVRLNI